MRAWGACASAWGGLCEGVTSHLDGLPAPVAVLLVLGEAPHVEVALDHLGPQDVVLLVLPHRDRLSPPTEPERLRTQLRDYTHARAQTVNDLRP